MEEEDDDDTEWTPVASKSEKPVALFEPKQEITHEVIEERKERETKEEWIVGYAEEVGWSDAISW